MVESSRISFSRVGAGCALLCAFSFARAQTGSISEAFQLQPREEFSFDLPKMSVSVDDETKEFNGVKITSPPDFNDQVFIGTYDDMFIKNKSGGREKVLYRELPEKAAFISKFEAQNIIKVNEYFISMLDVLEKLLQKGNWSRCLYLDAYVPHFLCSYYYLIGAARNSECALPLGARVPEDEFDISQNSPKSDARINRWRSSQDTVIKIRIACKELAKQLGLWEKNLDKVKDNVDVVTPKEMEDAYLTFIRAYFGLKPAAPVVVRKKHLY
jgi:hypothetical protein